MVAVVAETVRPVVEPVVAVVAVFCTTPRLFRPSASGFRWTLAVVVRAALSSPLVRMGQVDRIHHLAQLWLRSAAVAVVRNLAQPV